MAETRPHRENIRSIEIRNLAVGYEKPISKAHSLLLEPGKNFWLTGSSGLGKSTLLKVMAGLLNPLEGEIYFNGEPVHNMSFEEFLKYRLSIGFSFDLGGLMNNRSLWDNIVLPLAYHKWLPQEQIESRVKELVDLFHLQKFVGERPASVPGGIRKATCLARAFALEPNVLFLDEPIVGLNDEGVTALGQLLKEKREVGDSIVVMTARASQFVTEHVDVEIQVTATGLIERPMKVKKSGAA